MSPLLHTDTSKSNQFHALFLVVRYNTFNRLWCYYSQHSILGVIQSVCHRSVFMPQIILISNSDSCLLFVKPCFNWVKCAGNLVSYDVPQFLLLNIVKNLELNWDKITGNLHVSYHAPQFLMLNIVKHLNVIYQTSMNLQMHSAILSVRFLTMKIWSQTSALFVTYLYFCCTTVIEYHALDIIML